MHSRLCQRQQRSALTIEISRVGVVLAHQKSRSRNPRPALEPHLEFEQHIDEPFELAPIQGAAGRPMHRRRSQSGKGKLSREDRVGSGFVFVEVKPDVLSQCKVEQPANSLCFAVRSAGAAAAAERAKHLARALIVAP